VNRVSVEQDSHRAEFRVLITIPPLPHTHLSPPIAHYHIQVGGFISGPAPGCLQSEEVKGSSVSTVYRKSSCDCNGAQVSSNFFQMGLVFHKLRLEQRYANKFHERK
jgi:hypothetical protein